MSNNRRPAGRPAPDSRQLDCFREVIATGSIRAAADALNVEPSVVSRHIARLSADLGVALFERRGRGVIPTEAAQIVLAYCRERTASDDTLRGRLDDLRGLKRGTLQVMAGDGFAEAVMDRLLAAFCRRYPGVDVTLRAGSARDIVRAIADDDCHIGFTLSAPPHASVRVFRERPRPLRLVAKAGHPIAALREPVRLAALAGHAVALAMPGAGLHALVQTATEREGVTISASFTADRAATLRRYALAGLGVTFLSERMIARELAQGTLVARRTTSKVLENSRAQVLVRAGCTLSAPLRALLAEVKLIDAVL
jgi:DNA-binding transcriptional LysR family regulator